MITADKDGTSNTTVIAHTLDSNAHILLDTKL